MRFAGADPGFKVRGGALKKIAPCGGRREKCWGISCEKSRFYAKKIIYFSKFRGAPGAPRPCFVYCEWRYQDITEIVLKVPFNAITPYPFSILHAHFDSHWKCSVCEEDVNHRC